MGSNCMFRVEAHLTNQWFSKFDTPFRQAKVQVNAVARYKNMTVDWIWFYYSSIVSCSFIIPLLKVEWKKRLFCCSHRKLFTDWVFFLVFQLNSLCSKLEAQSITEENPKLMMNFPWTLKHRRKTRPTLRTQNLILHITNAAKIILSWKFLHVQLLWKLMMSKEISFCSWCIVCHIRKKHDVTDGIRFSPPICEIHKSLQHVFCWERRVVLFHAHEWASCPRIVFIEKQKLWNSQLCTISYLDQSEDLVKLMKKHEIRLNNCSEKQQKCSLNKENIVKILSGVNEKVLRYNVHKWKSIVSE